MTTWVYDDGGREESGRRGRAGDCVVRAIAIAGRYDYGDVYDELAARSAAAGGKRSAREGILAKVYKPYLAELGFEWTPTMTIGSGCRVHAVPAEVYEHAFGDGKTIYGVSFILNLSKHLSAMVDGVIRDTYDPSRDGTRCVYGYWKAP